VKQRRSKPILKEIRITNLKEIRSQQKDTTMKGESKEIIVINLKEILVKP
jgi:hypothetical protein